MYPEYTILAPTNMIISPKRMVNFSLNCNLKRVEMWRFNNGHILPKNAILSDNDRILTVFSSNMNNNGQYECVGINSRGILIFAASKVRVGKTASVSEFLRLD